MNHFFRTTVLAVAALAVTACNKTITQTSRVKSPEGMTAELWLTNGDKSALLEKQTTPLTFTNTTNNNVSIEVNEAHTYQDIDGFGYCLTGGSAELIFKMGKAERKSFLTELFATDGNNIGISYLRVSIGASDLDPTVFSYDDLPVGQTDATLSKFSLAPDKTYLIPILKEILAINPKIKLLGSPWSAPVWMKTNKNSKGGSLLPEYYDAYAQYFIKYIQGMKSEGITIDAITIQNEPLHPGNNPSMYMEAKDQAVFIKNHLGPAFETAAVKTKIIVYDHNCDKPDYPLEILKDAAANKYVDGSAFHLYGGKIDALSKVHDAYPNKNIYFTEQWTGGPGNFPEDLKWNVENLVIGATRNWSRIVLQWNLAADPAYKPFTPGGCTTCMGAVTIDGSKVTRNPAYYIIAHASKFVRPGSVRIETNLPENLQNVAFKTPEGKKVLIVLNTAKERKDFNIKIKGKTLVSSLNAGAVGTYIW